MQSSVNAIAQVKKALQELVRSGYAEQAGRVGFWRFPEFSPADGMGDALDGELGTGVDFEEAPPASSLLGGPLEVEKVLGQGPQEMYVYSYPAHRQKARLEGASEWLLKVGMSERSALDRIVEQMGTGTPEWPVVHMVVRCENARTLERLVHAALRARGVHSAASPGTEWFTTSPEWIERLLDFVLPELTPSQADQM